MRGSIAKHVAPLMLWWALTGWARADWPENGGFERSVQSSGIAGGWMDNSSWADLDVAYAVDKDNPHSGQTCQRITCTRLVGGAVQLIPVVGIPVRRGAIYRVSAWLRGNVGAVALQLRQAPAPYRVYVEQSLTVDDSWRQVDYFWTASIDDPRCRLMIRFTHPGTLWVDDVAVQEVDAEQAAHLASPPEEGNLLANGRFELGCAHWLLSHGADQWREARLAVDESEGNACLRWSIPEGVQATLSSDVVPVALGRRESISCRLRADRETTVTFSSNACGRRVTVGEAWKDVRAVGKVGFRPTAYDGVRLTARGPVELWIDDVQLRQDGQMEGERFRAAVLTRRHPLAWYHDGEKVGLRLLSSTPSGTAAPVVRWRVEDFWGVTRLQGEWQPQSGRDQMPIDASSLGRGWFRATATWLDSGRRRASRCAWVRLPPAERAGDIRTSSFGAHFSVDPTGLALARAVGCRWLRLHPPNHTKWRIVAATGPGEWNWRDEPIRIASQAGLRLVGSLDRCPDWASSAPQGTPAGGFYTGIGAWLPKRWSDWEKYVALTVRRYRGVIDIWEVWNEANLRNWLRPRPGQSRAQAYVEMLQHTYPVVKRENPAATVIGGVVAGQLTSRSTAWSFTEELIELGGLQLMDVFSFHSYLVRPMEEGEEPLPVWLRRLRERMRAAGRELPIIDSEGGFANPGGSLERPQAGDVVPADRMARWLVRQYVGQWAEGISRHFFYNFFVDGSPVVRLWEGFVEGDGQPRPNVAAYAVMTWLLDGAKFLRTDRPDEDTWLHSFDTPRGKLIVAWARSGVRHAIDLPPTVKGWDLMGAPLALGESPLMLTDAPVYLLLR